MKNYTKPEIEFCVYQINDILLSSSINRLDEVYDYTDSKDFEIFD